MRRTRVAGRYCRRRFTCLPPARMNFYVYLKTAADFSNLSDKNIRRPQPQIGVYCNSRNGRAAGVRLAEFSGGGQSVFCAQSCLSEWPDFNLLP